MHIDTTFDKAERLVQLLTERDWRISAAESCTGGMLAASLVDVPSTSSVFDASFVTYSNESKTRYLGVPCSLIEEHGVVSEPVAIAMAEGVAKANGAQVGVGISGIAGPTGGSPEKPIGTVCFGFYLNGRSFARTVHFGDLGRQAVRRASVEYVYDTLLTEL